jgi:hypothetical protein
MTKISYPTKGLISYYTFDKKNGKDYYGNHNLKLSNVKFDKGFNGSGYCIYLKDSYVSGFPKIDRNEPFYISMWVKDPCCEDAVLFEDFGKKNRITIRAKTIYAKIGAYDSIYFDIMVGNDTINGLKSYTIPKNLIDIKKWNQIGLGHDLNYMYVVLNGKIIKKIEAKGIRNNYSDLNSSPKMGRSTTNSDTAIVYGTYINEILIYKRMPSESEIEHIYISKPIINTKGE